MVTPIGPDGARPGGILAAERKSRAACGPAAPAMPTGSAARAVDGSADGRCRTDRAGARSTLPDALRSLALHLAAGLVGAPAPPFAAKARGEGRMAVRIGIGLGLGGFPFASIGEFRAWLDRVEDSRIDSVWQSDRVVSRDPALEPIALLSVVAGATRRLKLGTNAIVLPFHDPIAFARQCATLDWLSEGRLLPTVAVGRDDAPEWVATGRSPKGRGEWVDEALEVMTRLWSTDVANFEGRHHRLCDASISPRPKQSPLPLWIGGSSPGAIRRTARFGHGWLAPLASADEAAATVAAIRAECARIGRAIPDDHYGATFLFRLGPDAERFPSPFARIPDPAMRRRFESVLAVGDAERVLERIRAFRAGGITKFIAIPLARDAAEMIEQSRLLDAEILPHAND